MGIFVSQNDIGSPKTRTSNPFIVRKCAATDMPYGPAPITDTSHRVIAMKFQTNLYPAYLMRKERTAEHSHRCGSRFIHIDARDDHAADPG